MGEVFGMHVNGQICLRTDWLPGVLCILSQELRYRMIRVKKKRGRNFYGRIRSRVNGTLVLPMSNILLTSRTAIRLMELTLTLISQSA